MNTTAAPTARITAIHCLRWAAVLGLVFCAATGLVYSVGQMSIARCLLFLLVIAGAKLAPRFRLTTAIVLAAVFIARSYWGHVLALAPEGMANAQLLTGALTGHYRHFSLDALGPVLAVVYVFWSEKARLPPG